MARRTIITITTLFMNRLLLLSASLALALNASSALSGQDVLIHPTSPNYEEEAAKLRAMPPRPYEFSKAMLGDVIRFMATDAGISFFSLPDGSPEGDKLITFTLNASPFQALETLCKANQLALVYDGGIWYVRPADDKELIGKAYEVRHNAMEKVTKVNAGGTSSGSSVGGPSSAPMGGGEPGDGNGLA